MSGNTNWDHLTQPLRAQQGAADTEAAQAQLVHSETIALAADAARRLRAANIGITKVAEIPYQHLGRLLGAAEFHQPPGQQQVDPSRVAGWLLQSYVSRDTDSGALVRQSGILLGWEGYLARFAYESQRGPAAAVSLFQNDIHAERSIENYGNPFTFQPISSQNIIHQDTQYQQQMARLLFGEGLA
jgi:hypothetical protein